MLALPNNSLSIAVGTMTEVSETTPFTLRLNTLLRKLLSGDIALTRVDLPDPEFSTTNILVSGTHL